MTPKKEIGNDFNYTDVFVRDVTIGLLDTLESSVRYINKFERENITVDVPFFYAMGNNERFLLDTFVDDVVSDVRLNEFNSDVIPRGMVNLSNFNVKSEEFTNPNLFISIVENMEDELVTLRHNIRAIPLRLSYDLEIHANSLIEILKISQAVLNTLWVYSYFSIEYKGMNIDCVLEVPDDHSFDINMEHNLSSDTTKKMNIQLEVHTNYPAYLQPGLDTNMLREARRTKWYSTIKKANRN